MIEDTSQAKENMRKQAFFPYIIRFVFAITVYIGCPIFAIILLLTLRSSSFSIQIGIVLFGGVSIIYFLFIRPRFRLGLLLWLDIICNAFATHQIQFQDSIIDYWSHYFINDFEISLSGKTKKKKLKEEAFLQVVCRGENNEYIHLSSARYHGMISGKKYMVVYGKYSKILISVLSEEGEQLWDIPYERWIMKRARAFPPHKNGKK